VSAIGTPMPHIVPHFDGRGMCICPCEDCTTRTAHFCVCLDCPCDEPGDHAWGWHLLSDCPDEVACPIHGRNEDATHSGGGSGGESRA